jgi:hypothetical protein
VSTGEHESGSRARRILTRYQTPVWLLGLALAFGVLAFLLYPDDTPVTPDDAVQGVAFLSSFTPTAINLTQTPDPQVDGFTLQIVVHASVQPSHSGTIVIELPTDAFGTYKACPVPLAEECPHDLAGLKNAVYALPSTWLNGGPSQTAATRNELRLTVTVKDAGSNLSRDAEYISVLTPPVSVQLSSTKAYVTVPTFYNEQVPNGDAYTWSTGQVPVYVNDLDSWTGSSASGPQESASPTLDSGIDLAVQSRDGNLQFIAGIVVGVAGGALVGAMQEWLDCRRRSQGDAG